MHHSSQGTFRAIMLLLFQTLYLRNITYEALESKGYRWKMTLLIHPIELFWICGNFQQKKRKKEKLIHIFVNLPLQQLTEVSYPVYALLHSPPPTDAIFLWMIR